MRHQTSKQHSKFRTKANVRRVEGTRVILRNFLFSSCQWFIYQLFSVRNVACGARILFIIYLWVNCAFFGTNGRWMPCFLVDIHVSECGVYGRSGSSFGGGNSGRSSSYNARRYSGSSYDGAEPYPEAAKQKGAAPRTSKSSGFSAWGLIMIITTVIILGFGAYYGIICYPFFCKHERTYQFMDASSTITGATSRSIQSIENFQHDQKAALWVPNHAMGPLAVALCSIPFSVGVDAEI